MGHSSIRLKVRRRRVAILAARSRQFDVKNHKKKLAQSKDWKMVPFDTWLDRMPRFGYVKVAGKYYTIDKNGVHFKDDSWKSERHKQPKQLIKWKKRKHTGEKWVTNSVGCLMRVYDVKRHKRNDFLTFKNYPYNLPKMNRTEYMEKLVEHKLAKWEKKNPCPVKEDNDMFENEFMTPWNIARNKAEERFRDFVVSIYDKLLLTGRFKMNKNGTATYQEEKVAELKDINGEGHKVNELGKDSKLLKKAQEITNKVHAKHPNLVATNLRDHKRTRGRIILPKAA